MPAAWVAYALAGWGPVTAEGSASTSGDGLVLVAGVHATERSVLVIATGAVVLVGRKGALSIRPE